MDRTKSLESVNIPDGNYYGRWTAYTVSVLLPNQEGIDVKVDTGVRGIRVKCAVEIIAGWMYVDAI